MTRTEQLTQRIRFDYEQRDTLATDPKSWAEYQSLLNERSRIAGTTEADEEIPVPTAQEQAVITVARCRHAIHAMIAQARRTDKGRLPDYIIRNSIRSNRAKLHQAWVELRRANIRAGRVG